MTIENFLYSYINLLILCGCKQQNSLTNLSSKRLFRAILFTIAKEWKNSKYIHRRMDESVVGIMASCMMAPLRLHMDPKGDLATVIKRKRNMEAGRKKQAPKPDSLDSFLGRKTERNCWFPKKTSGV